MHPAITKQPESVEGAPANQRLWSSGVLGCFDDMGSCVIGAAVPWVLALQVAGDLGESSCVPLCVPNPCACLFAPHTSAIILRTKLRTMHNIQGSIMDDCLMANLCFHCVMCQMVRELDYIKRVGTQ